jgi:hypothetical protein
LPVPRPIFIGQLLNQEDDGSWSQIEGRVTQIRPGPDGLEMELGVGTARMEVRVNPATDGSRMPLMDSLIRVTGFCLGGYNSDGLKVPNLLLVPAGRFIEIMAPPGGTAGTNTIPAAMPVLTKAAEVHQLKREKAELSYPVKVRGVVTSVDSGPPGFTLQDSTGGVYVQGADPVRLGDFVEVEGVTDPGVFAPMLRPGRIQQLGEGRLPEPIVPTWDQLMNGSLDAQYVEIEGIVTAGTLGNMQFLTHGGAITIELINGLNPMDMKQYENTLIQVRGVLFADWNPDTHQVKLGEIRLFDPQVTVENPTPVDMLSAPYKTPTELMQFDPQASLFQRIRMAGQIVFVGQAACFMMAGDSGVRFMPKTPAEFQVGDLVEVVGFPQLGGAAPLLREAMVRKTGNAALPEARRLPPGNVSAARFDATRVSVAGVLTGTRAEAGPQMVLEMQDGAQEMIFCVRSPSVPGSNSPASMPLKEGNKSGTATWAPLNCCWTRPRMSKFWHDHPGGPSGACWSWWASWCVSSWWPCSGLPSSTGRSKNAPFSSKSKSRSAKTSNNTGRWSTSAPASPRTCTMNSVPASPRSACWPPFPSVPPPRPPGLWIKSETGPDTWSPPSTKLSGR